MNGGAVLNNGGAVALDAMLIAENDATYGGAVSCYQGTTTITNSILRANSAAEYGGAILNDAGTLILNNVRSEGNVAWYGGGDFRVYRPTQRSTTVFSSAIQPSNGAGVFNDAGTLFLNNCTVTANVASGSGGGLLNNNGDAHRKQLDRRFEYGIFVAKRLW